MANDFHRSSIPSPFDDALSSLDRRISRFSAVDHSVWAAAADSSAFLDALDELQSLISEWSPMAGDEKPVAVSLHHAVDLLKKAMFRLEMEFRTVLDKGGESFDLVRNGESTPSRGGEYGYGLSEEEEEDDEVFINGAGESILVARPVNDYNVWIEALPAGTIGDLHEIARRMVVAGFEKESSHAYSGNRRDFLEESLSRLGLQKLSTEEVLEMAWADLVDEIDRWTVAANVALKILFPSERRLCERVFSGYPSASDLSFMEVCRGSAIQLLNFADAIATSSPAPERLVKVLDVYETLGNLMSDFELLFSNQHCAPLRNEAVTVWKRLGESIRGIFMELENRIRRDPAKQVSAAGGVHPITRFVTNLLRAACKSRQTLEKVFEEGVVSSGGRASNPSITSLNVKIAWIMELLDSNLEANSRMYKDMTLSSVFMMNNGRYIVQKVSDNELGELLGDDWINKQNSKLGKFHMNYQRSSWSKALGALKLDNASVPLRERISLFNNCFDETCKAQSSWIVVDDQLREELKAEVAETLTSAYRKFLDRFRNANADRLIKYSVEEVEARINNELFQGSARRK